MGASCVRDCERTTHELYTSDDGLPLQAGMPGLTSGGDVKVGAAFANPMAAISGGAGGSAVPPLYAMKGVHEVDPRSPRETPRFDEVTPRPSDGAFSYRTPNASPRDSPRPADEQRMDAPIEISYEGEKLEGMKHGQGKLRMQGSGYEGEFKNDAKHGQGVLAWDDGRQYRGQFEDNKFHGSAVMTWPDGRKYCGQYIEDRKHGDGTFSWQDGRRYQGQWVVGKRHGVGVYTNAKGLTRTGLWQMDRPLHWEVANATQGLPSPPTLTVHAKLEEAPPPPDMPSGLGDAVTDVEQVTPNTELQNVEIR
mmetsp:Transcript_64121/g.101756  ORF Transcript_64121/g.101756 Transcript_64121/m.101756 type:complete len:307 (-) Transcript_64121:24-944(-)|eukprot:CAMPEP_0169122864 /NCGR_PEP_ID=MMETSP1015-20121227/33465_1 /TAXON_ID=342587 /ORGANISM="Karlodinium micrum, Strain CCMP2283" /LENGTH=306 /DNA_ID=CAMNT_0009186135 /DNA_START=133 /DNA_END=1053 /DNA_ORIENTATION=+